MNNNGYNDADDVGPFDISGLLDGAFSQSQPPPLPPPPLPPPQMKDNGSSTTVTLSQQKTARGKNNKRKLSRNGVKDLTLYSSSANPVNYERQNLYASTQTNDFPVKENEWILVAKYDLNLSGSKTLSIGLDAREGCTTLINIGKGDMAVKLTPAGFKEIVSLVPYIDYYFESGKGDETFQIDLNNKLYTTSIHDNRSLIIQRQDGKYRYVVLQEPTWRGFKNILSCAQILIQQRIKWEPLVRIYFEKLCSFIRPNKYDNLDERIMESLKTSQPLEENDFYRILHAEIQTFCKQSVINYINKTLYN